MAVEVLDSPPEDSECDRLDTPDSLLYLGGGSINVNGRSFGSGGVAGDESSVLVDAGDSAASSASTAAMAVLINGTMVASASSRVGGARLAPSSSLIRT